MPPGCSLCEQPLAPRARTMAVRVFRCQDCLRTDTNLSPISRSAVNLSSAGHALLALKRLLGSAPSARASRPLRSSTRSYEDWRSSPFRFATAMPAIGGPGPPSGSIATPSPGAGTLTRWSARCFVFCPSDRAQDRGDTDVDRSPRRGQRLSAPSSLCQAAQ